MKQSLAEGDKAEKSSSSGDQDAAKSDSNTESNKGEENADATKEGEEKTNEGNAETSEGENKDGEGDKGPVPYERFEEVNQRLKSYEQQTASLKPKADNYDTINGFLQQFNITPDRFQRMLKVEALISTDPEAALKELMPIVDQLQGFVGGKLPEDLQKAVDNEEITPALAKRLAQYEAKLKFGSVNSEQMQRRMMEQQQQQAQQRVAQAVQVWENTKRSSDPDYKPKAKETDADGKWEQVKERFMFLLHDTDGQGNVKNPIRNEQEMTALMERAYTDVSKRFISRTKPQPTKKVLSSNGSASSASKPKDPSQYASMSEYVAATVK